jgi:hypothetical protein
LSGVSNVEEEAHAFDKGDERSSQESYKKNDNCKSKSFNSNSLLSGSSVAVHDHSFTNVSAMPMVTGLAFGKNVDAAMANAASSSSHEHDIDGVSIVGHGVARVTRSDVEQTPFATKLGTSGFLPPRTSEEYTIHSDGDDAPGSIHDDSDSDIEHAHDQIDGSLSPRHAAQKYGPHSSSSCSKYLNSEFGGRRLR